MAKNSLTPTNLIKERKNKSRQEKTNEQKRKKGFSFFYSATNEAFTDALNELETTSRQQSTLLKINRPQWFWTTPFGVPRGVDIIGLRDLASSSFIQAIISAKTKDLQATEYKLVPRDKKMANDPRVIAKIEEINAFFNHVNANGETLKDVYCRAFRDSCEIDAFVVVKHFDKKVHQEIDFSEVIKDERFSRQTYVPHDAPPGYLREITAEDGARFLKQLDQTGRIIGYWEHPLTTSGGGGATTSYATFYSQREVIYLTVNQPTYSPYGWSPVQQLYHVLIAMITTVINTAKYMEKGALAPGVLAIEGFDIDDDDYEALRDYWLNELQGNPHRFGIMYSPQGNIKFVPFNFSISDITFLEGLDFYWRLAMAAYHVTPQQLGLTDTVNKATSEEQAKVDRRISRAPTLALIKRMVDNYILPELDPEKLVEFKWEPLEDIDKDLMIQQKRDAQLQNGERTINELRLEDGLEPVEWGIVPFTVVLEAMRAQNQTVNPFGIPNSLFENLMNRATEEQIDPENLEVVIEEIEDENDIPDQQEEDETEKPELNETSMNYQIDYRQDIIKVFLSKGNDIDEEKFSRLIDEIIRKPANEIEKTVLDTLEQWKQEILDKIMLLYNQGMTMDESIIKVLKEYVQMPDSLFTYVNSNIYEILTEVFMKMLNVNNNLEFDESVFQVVPEDELRFLRANSLLISDKLSSDISQQLLRQFMEGISRGESIDDLTDRILSVFQTSEARARTIARTETVRAMVEGRFSQIERDYEEWEFFAHIDDRTDEECRNLHMKIFKTSDRRFLPPRHPNCRCTVLAVVPENES